MGIESHFNFTKEEKRHYDKMLDNMSQLFRLVKNRNPDTFNRLVLSLLYSMGCALELHYLSVLVKGLEIKLDERVREDLKEGEIRGAEILADEGESEQNE